MEPIFWFYQEFIINKHRIVDIEVGEDGFSAKMAPNAEISFYRFDKRMQVAFVYEELWR